MRKIFYRSIVILSLLLSAGLAFAQTAGPFFQIRVVDEQTGRGVPLVELKTTNQVCYYTDSNGLVAFFEPGLMNQQVFFHLKSHGYEYPADGFGYRGKALFTKPGDSAVVRLRRVNIAERLYRLTGEGIYNYSSQLGFPVPLRQPLLNGKVLGQDTFVETWYNGKIYWFWGDTDRPSYPLGNFATSGATSELPGKGGLDPAIGVDFTYFTDESGFSKKMCPLPGPGPVWIHFLTTVKDSTGRLRLVTSFTRIKNLGEAYERGLAVFNDSAKVFEPVVRFPLSTPFFPEGHSSKTLVNGVTYLNFDFGTPFPLRVQADWKHLFDPASYEAFTCLAEGSRYDTAHLRVDRKPGGELVYGWKTHTDPLDADKEQFLIKKGLLKPGETWFNFLDFLTGKPVLSKTGSVFWNDYRQKWVMVFQQVKGSSHLGEVWFAEGDTPTGPWVYARKIVTHDRYTFYNVGQHPLFDQEKGRLIYFEGTYTESFSGNPVPTPRYNYNQIMYRLDLNDPRLYLPAPVYLVKAGKSASHYLMREEVATEYNWKKISAIPFFALPPDRQAEGAVPVFAVIEKGQTKLSIRSPGRQARPLFYALPRQEENAPMLTGAWVCQADEWPLKMELQLAGSQLTGKIEGESLLFQKGSVRNDTISLLINDLSENRLYEVKAVLTAGRLEGEFRAVNGSEKGRFSGKKADTGAEMAQSSMVVPLYEFKDRNGNITYSVDSEIEGFKRSAQPVCRVWKNPSSILTVDFEAKPVPVGD